MPKRYCSALTLLCLHVARLNSLRKVFVFGFDFFSRFRNSSFFARAFKNKRIQKYLSINIHQSWLARKHQRQQQQLLFIQRGCTDTSCNQTSVHGERNGIFDNAKMKKLLVRSSLATFIIYLKTQNNWKVEETKCIWEKINTIFTSFPCSFYWRRLRGDLINSLYIGVSVNQRQSVVSLNKKGVSVCCFSEIFNILSNLS